MAVEMASAIFMETGATATAAESKIGAAVRMEEVPAEALVVAGCGPAKATGIPQQQ